MIIFTSYIKISVPERLLNELVDIGKKPFHYALYKLNSLFFAFNGTHPLAVPIAGHVHWAIALTSVSARYVLLQDVIAARHMYVLQRALV